MTGRSVSSRPRSARTPATQPTTDLVTDITRVRAVRRAPSAPYHSVTSCAVLQDHQRVGVGVGQHLADRRLAAVEP